MKNIIIESGDIESGLWRIEGSCITTGNYNVQEIPISDIVRINKKEVIGKKYYVEFELGTTQKFTATMKEKTYSAIYDIFVKVGNKPTNTKLPLRRKSKKNAIWSTVGVIFLLLLVFGGDKDVELNTKNKTDLCKAYIGALFHQPVSIIYNYKNENGIIYVRYTRPSDFSAWTYKCDVQSGHMSWAGWLTDVQKWGRWRYEDEVKLNYSKNKVSFNSPNTNKKIEINISTEEAVKASSTKSKPSQVLNASDIIDIRTTFGKTIPDIYNEIYSEPRHTKQNIPLELKPGITLDELKKKIGKSSAFHVNIPDTDMKISFETSDYKVNYTVVKFTDTAPCSKLKTFDPFLYILKSGIPKDDLKLVKSKGTRYVFLEKNNKFKVVINCAVEFKDRELMLVVIDKQISSD